MFSCFNFRAKSQVIHQYINQFAFTFVHEILNLIVFHRNELLEWFIDLQLSEYTHLFDSTEDVAWLDKLNQRYAWFKRQLLQCEEKFGAMFPVQWELSERIAVEFCKITK